MKLSDGFCRMTSWFQLSFVAAINQPVCLRQSTGSRTFSHMHTAINLSPPIGLLVDVNFETDPSYDARQNTALCHSAAGTQAGLLYSDTVFTFFNQSCRVHQCCFRYRNGKKISETETKVGDKYHTKKWKLLNKYQKGVDETICRRQRTTTKLEPYPENHGSVRPDPARPANDMNALQLYSKQINKLRFLNSLN